MATSQLIVVSAPSGCGKTTIVRELLRRHPEIEFSVSATTRPRRPQEVHGRDYFFLSREEFQKKIKQGDLVEWEEIYGDLYGTLRSEVDRALREGKSMVFDVDVKGAVSIKEKYPQAVLIFIKPPSIDAAKERLRRRKTETEESLRKRFERMPMELAQEKFFDFSVANDEVSRAVDEVERVAGLKARTRRFSSF